MHKHPIITAALLMVLGLVSCNKKTDIPWWQETVFYQIYMPSFQDSNGDGYSDFRGMTNRLDYIKDLGIKGIWLTPFLESPKVDNGYDIADYYAIDPVYGTIDDFKSFIHEAHARGIYVIMDMVVNHSSTDCEWFQQARTSPDNPYRQYYIWQDQPNNWESFFGGPAWTFDSLAGQYYYHQFDKRMADLNWTNPELIEEIKNVLRYWLDLGIDGFRMDVINFLTTDGILEENPMADGKQIHKYDIDQPGVKNAMKIIKETVNEYDNRFVVGEVGSDQIDILKQYQSYEMMDVVFNFNFGSIPEFSADQLFNELKSMEEKMPGMPTLFFGSHDNPRLMNRLAENNTERALALAALMLTAKGVPFIYYGEEIGMQNIEATSVEEIVDVQGRTQYTLAMEAGKSPDEALQVGNKHNRDKSRSPMQWNPGPHAGFTSGTPWIRLHPDYPMVNVETYLDLEHSILNQYKALIALRNQHKPLQYGDYLTLENDEGCIWFTREYEGEKINVYVNFGGQTKIEVPEGAQILLGNTYLETDSFLVLKH